MSSLLRFLTDSAVYYPIFSRITQYLDPPDIFRLIRTGSVLAGFYDEVKRTQWCVEASLGCFFQDVKYFRALQAETDALITGEFARDFFLRRRSPEGRLVVVVSVGRKGDAITAFLKSEGYLPSINQANNSITTEVGYERVTSGCSRKMYIRVCYTAETPILSILRYTPSSSKMCVITSNKAYCLFPILTVLRHESYLLHPLRTADETSDRGLRTSLQEDTRAGMKLKDPSWDRVSGHGALFNRANSFRLWRQVGDKISWTMTLEGMKANPLCDEALEYATFTITSTENPQSSILPYYNISSQSFASPVLKHTYAIGPGPNELIARGPHETLIKSVNNALVLQLSLLDPAQRPSQYAQVSREISSSRLLRETDIGDFKELPSWTYHDEDVLDFLKFVRVHRIEQNRL